MTVKPLNLSILIGDMNRNTPQSSPRPTVLAPNNKKSRIPLATSQTLPGNVQGGRTTFRQWADPPPPPNRSRPLDRKSSLPYKKRPGSADPRFRRSLETTKISVPPKNEPIKQSSSFCELIAPTIQDTKPKDLREPIPQVDKIIERFEDKIEFLKPVNFEEETPELKQMHLRDVSPIRKRLRSTKYTEPEKYQNVDEILSVYPLPFDKQKEIHEIYNDNDMHTQSESKYSQTDVFSNYFNRDNLTEVAEQSEPANNSRETDILQFLANNYERTSRYLDGIVLNRTRSISTVYELETVDRKSTLTRTYNTVSRILLQQNYWTYLELWAGLTFLLAVLLFGWFYFVPYIFDVYFDWMYPIPETTAMDYYRSSIGDICTSTAESLYNLLTTPANKRLS